MSITEFTPIEARVLGCLLEKAVTTPDQYPLSLNALTNACNQKSARDPVMSLDPGEVQRAINSLEEKHVARRDENFKTQVEKYTHRFCNTPFSDYQFDSAQYAAVCVLLLRGPRTPGEIRANSGRLHSFADNEEVVETLDTLRVAPNAIVQRLERTPGRRDHEYTHLFFGESESSKPMSTLQNSGKVDLAERPSRPDDDNPMSNDMNHVDLAARVQSLESEMKALKNIIQDLVETKIT